MPIWRDNKRDGVIGSADVKVGGFTLVVHRYVGYPPGVWLGSCYGMFEKKELKCSELKDAKIELIEFVKQKLTVTLNDLNTIEVEK